MILAASDAYAADINVPADELTIQAGIDAAKLSFSASFGGCGCTFNIATADQAIADYLGDGIADQVEIQQAFDDLPPGSASVCFAAGTYSLDQQAGEDYAIQLVRSDVSLSFNPNAILRLSDSQIGTNETCHVLRILGSDITISGPGVLDGNRDNNLGPIGIATTNNEGIRVQSNPSNFTIEGGFTIRNVIGVGLHVLGNGTTYRITATNLSILDSGEGFLIHKANSIRISNLLIDGMDKQDGFEPLGVHDLVMRDSAIRNTRDSAIDIVNVHSFVGQNLRHTYTNCTLGPLLPNSFPLAGVFEVGSKQMFFTNEDITLQASSIDMGNADFGVVLGDFDGTATHQSLFSTVSGVIIDGTNAKPGAVGIGVSDLAVFTTLVGNLISNCPVAIDRTLNPSDLTIRNNDGTGNAVDITPGSGANNIRIDNFGKYSRRR